MELLAINQTGNASYEVVLPATRPAVSARSCNHCEWQALVLHKQDLLSLPLLIPLQYKVCILLKFLARLTKVLITVMSA